MKTRKSRIFMGDFETTVFEGQTYTEVWAAACVEMGTEEVQIFHSIGEQYNYFNKLNTSIIVYYHNLKFDGVFWLSYLMRDLGYKQAARRKSTGEDELNSEDTNDFEFLKEWNMMPKTFAYMISDMGQWYKIIVKMGDKRYLEIRDSLKLLPFSVKLIGETFGTKHKKLDMEYKGLRYAGCPISEKEQDYIKNDVLVVKEALEIMFAEGHKKLTIGSCALDEFKKTINRETYEEFFPNLYLYPLNKAVFGAESIGAYIRKSYRGGWCYLARGKEKKIYQNGVTCDVNSLYPSMLHSESGNKYPIGLPRFWRGNAIPAEALEFDSYYFVRFITRFYIKKDKLPFIQIKNSFLYRGTESLETSDIYDKHTGKYYAYVNKNGEEYPAKVTLTMTMTDFTLFREHYNVEDFEILDGCYFKTYIGLFDDYINKYRKIKMTTKGAKRQLAKLMLNSLYGKMAASMDSSYKVAVLLNDGSIGFRTVTAADKPPGYIPIGSAITSYARNFTIRAAQANYYGVDKPGFIYADTDSIHCDLPEEQIKGVRLHDSDFCAWKIECKWDQGYFLRQKTYIEHVPGEQAHYEIKCAGMPSHCKQLFAYTLEPMKKTAFKNLSQAEIDFIKKPCKITDFDIGLKIPGKLLPKRIPGGTLLVETTYELR